MLKIKYQTGRILDLLTEKIKKETYESVVWLGYSPGFSVVYKMLLEKNVHKIRILDNDRSKQGWEVFPLSEAGEEKPDQSIRVEPVQQIRQDSSVLYVCANTHYRDFVKQLGSCGVEERQILDLNGILLGWMKDEEEPGVSGFCALQGRELQLEQLKILKWFRDFCRENHLTWYLGEGTLLGAVRHKGFIPWDDDIDTFMPYEDYLKCIEQMPREGKFHILDWRTDRRYPFQFAKVVEEGTCQIHPIPFGYFTLGCHIDIFPLAGYPDDEEQIREKYDRHKILDALWDRLRIEEDYLGGHIRDQRQEITEEKYKIPFYEAGKVGTMQQIAGNAWAVDRTHFEKRIRMQFEDEEFPVPCGYDAFLRARYGNYMELPPADKRRIHSYAAYRINGCSLENRKRDLIWGNDS